MTNMDNLFRLILYIAPLKLSFVMGMGTDMETCMQKTPMDILALCVMMAGEQMKLMLCVGTTPFFSTEKLR